MTLDEALAWSDRFAESLTPTTSTVTAMTLAAEVRRLQAEVERLPARRAQQTVKSKQVGPCDHAYWRLSHETDAEFAEWGNEYTEVAR